MLIDVTAVRPVEERDRDDKASAVIEEAGELCPRGTTKTGEDGPEAVVWSTLAMTDGVTELDVRELRVVNP